MSTLRRRTCWTAALTAVAAVGLHRPLVGAFYAHLGALSQGLGELLDYRWPDPSPAAMRETADPNRGGGYLTRALVCDLGNCSANERLVLLELSQDENDDANC